MHFQSLAVGIVNALVATQAKAHGAKRAAQEVVELREFMQHNKHDLSHCADALAARNLDARNVERRATLTRALMRKGGLQVTSQARVDGSHRSDEKYTPGTEESVVFAGNNSCVLAPEQIDGPYYVAGERVRQDLVEDQDGVPLALDIQVVDINTCEPIEGAYIDIWHCNATGVYGGVSNEGNGDGPSDKANIDNTWLRGAQETDEDGAVQFHSIFPGFYTGRAVHIHVAVHLNASMLANGTLLDNTAAHVGQMYFDEDLITEVNKLGPYKDNKSIYVSNAEDILLAAVADSDADPLMEYAMLGERLEDGLIAWLSMGVNTSYMHEIVPAVTLYEEGGVANPDAMTGPPPGGLPDGFPGIPGIPGMPGMPAPPTPSP